MDEYGRRTREKKNQVNKENPTGNLGEAINRSMVGTLGALANGGCLTKIITVVIIIGGLLILSRCSN